jgi:chemotaxis protein CheC
MTVLEQEKIDRLTRLLGHGAGEASIALSKWLDRPANVSFDSLQQVSLEEVGSFLGPAEGVLAACIMELSGGLRGSMIFCFDDSSGLRLADIVLNRPIGSSQSWEEWEKSAVMETANITGCAYLNSIAKAFSESYHQAASDTWLPSPPQFIREYAAAMLEFAVMQQAAEFDTLLLGNTQFFVDGLPMHWNLLLIPDAASLQQLSKVLV